MRSHLQVLVVTYAYPLGLYGTLLLSPLIFSRFSHARKFNDFTSNKRTFTAIWFLQLWLSLCLLVSAILAAPPFISALRHSLDVELAEAYLVCFAAVALYFGAGLLPDPDGPFQPSLSHFTAWILTAIFEVTILILSFGKYEGSFDAAQTSLGGIRAFTLICMSAAYIYLRREKRLNNVNENETQSLLTNGNSTQPNYGLVNGKVPTQNQAFADAKRGGWLDYFIGFRVLFPYIWPSDSRKQQLILLLSLLLMIGQRVINVLVPYQLALLVEAIGVGTMPYKEICLYVLFRGLQGQQGVLGSLRAILWIPISQSLFRRLTCGAFQHILTLSLEFHLSKKIGEVMTALSKGSALNTFLDSFAFNLFPMVFDLGIAAVYFIIRFDAFYSLILVGVMWCYVYMTIYMAQWRGKARRVMALKDREMNAVKMDTMLSYETVHHNNAIAVEVDRFEDHVAKYQKAEFSVVFSLNVLNITQNLILTFGILLVILLSSLQISVAMHTVAMFVSILAYFTQLQAPLQFFGSFYSQVQNNLIDAERMLNLFKEKPSITDAENAIQLTGCTGGIAFYNVSFAYDGRKLAIENMSFVAEPGTSTAIVGESGSGKSTCLTLLFRFYDVTSGSIEIDGHDIRDLGSVSYRGHIGVVPQDTLLFNTSIMYNLRYAKPDAREQEVYDACRAASIHDKILNFPDGYETKVGERGLRLSGGEKQRIAIARAILKNPQIILLDEATASLDSHTEKQIQGALETVTKGRTTITVAHRLSTITKCDQILVLHEGKIVERGTHEELLAKGGRYSAMWEKQTKTQKEALDTSE